MEDTLNWLCSKGLDLDDDDTDVSSFNKLGEIPMGMRSVHEKDRHTKNYDRHTKNMLSWIRKADDDNDNEGANAFSNLDFLLPVREGQTEQYRATGVVNALAWLQSGTRRINVNGYRKLSTHEYDCRHVDNDTQRGVPNHSNLMEVTVEII
jgi:hypothetical protein